MCLHKIWSLILFCFRCIGRAPSPPLPPCGHSDHSLPWYLCLQGPRLAWTLEALKLAPLPCSEALWIRCAISFAVFSPAQGPCSERPPPQTQKNTCTKTCTSDSPRSTLLLSCISCLQAQKTFDFSFNFLRALPWQKLTSLVRVHINSWQAQFCTVNCCLAPTEVRAVTVVGFGDWWVWDLWEIHLYTWCCSLSFLSLFFLENCKENHQKNKDFLSLPKP